MSADGVLVLGAGGHARVIMALLSHAGEPVRGLLDAAAPRAGETIGGSRVIGTFDELEDLYARGARRVVLAVGDNARRAALHVRVLALGFETVGLRHPLAAIEPGAQVADDAVLCARAFIAADARVGANVLINSGAIVEHEATVGDHAHVAPAAVLAGRSAVGRGTFVGMGSLVRDGVRVGAGVVIGAGAAVIGDLPDGVVAVGVPARIRPDLRSPWGLGA